MFRIQQCIFAKLNKPGLRTSVERFVFDEVLRKYLNYATHILNVKSIPIL